MLRLMIDAIRCRGGRRVIALFRLAQALEATGHARTANICIRRIERNYGVYIHKSARLGNDVRFPHPVGIVIGAGVVVGDGVTIFQGVTLGGARLGDAGSGSYPQIGARTVLFAGSKIVGSIEAGMDCVVGANAVVVSNVPDYSLAVGVPATVRPRRDINCDPRTD